MDLGNTKDKKWMSRELQMEINCSGIITIITENCSDILGYTQTDMINSNIDRYISLTFNDFLSRREFIVEGIKKDGTRSYFDIVVTNITYSQEKALSIDLSMINANKYRDLQDREKMFRRMLDNSKDIVCRLELFPEPHFTYMSPSVEDILGYKTEEYYKNPMLPFQIIHPEDSEKQLSKISGKTDFSTLFELRFKHIDGHYIWLQDYIIPTYNEKGQLIAVHSITRNIQERKELEAELKRLSFTDGLTGLFNRNYLNTQIQNLSEGINVPIGIIVCDLDNLKYVNDTLGHQTGDLLIKDVSSFFVNTFSGNHIIVRTGGDEFIILMPNISLKEAEEAYSRMVYLLAEYNQANEMPIELSAGLSYSTSSQSILEHLSRADKNMYKNKYNKKRER